MLRVLFSPPQRVDREAQRVTQLLESDWDYFHLKKAASSLEYCTQLLVSIPAELHPKIVLHQHFELVDSFPLAGIALNADKVSHPERYGIVFRSGLPLFRGRRVRAVAYSAHAVAEAKALKIPVRYALLSPLFDSISKPGRAGKFADRKQLTDQLRTLKIPAVALGGITDERIALCQKWGFKGIAQLGAVWCSLGSTSLTWA